VMMMLMLLPLLLLLVWALVKALAALAAQSSRKRLPRSACGPLEFLPSRACTSIPHVAQPHDTQAATWPRRLQLAPTAALFDKVNGGDSEARLLVPSFDDVLRYLSAVSGCFTRSISSWLGFSPHPPTHTSSPAHPQHASGSATSVVPRRR